LKAYCDTSFLVSLYAPDRNSEAAAAEIGRRSPTLLITPLCELELVNALQLRVFRRELTAREAHAGQAALQNDISDGVYSVQPLSAKVFEMAKRLALKHSATAGSRSLDVLHVAAAVVLDAETVFSFDQSQRRLVTAAGLHVAPAGKRG